MTVEKLLISRLTNFQIIFFTMQDGERRKEMTARLFIFCLLCCQDSEGQHRMGPLQQWLKIFTLQANIVIKLLHLPAKNIQRLEKWQLPSNEFLAGGNLIKVWYYHKIFFSFILSNIFIIYKWNLNAMRPSSKRMCCWFTAWYEGWW